MRPSSHFDCSEEESRHETKWRAPKGNLLFNRFLHFGPPCGPPVEMTKMQFLITIGMTNRGRGIFQQSGVPDYFSAKPVAHKWAGFLPMWFWTAALAANSYPRWPRR